MEPPFSLGTCYSSNTFTFNYSFKDFITFSCAQMPMVVRDNLGLECNSVSYLMWVLGTELGFSLSALDH